MCTILVTSGATVYLTVVYEQLWVSLASDAAMSLSDYI